MVFEGFSIFQFANFRMMKTKVDGVKHVVTTEQSQTGRVRPLLHRQQTSRSLTLSYFLLGSEGAAGAPLPDGSGLGRFVSITASLQRSLRSQRCFPVSSLQPWNKASETPEPRTIHQTPSCSRLQRPGLTETAVLRLLTTVVSDGHVQKGLWK